jgi:hypothetical protein
MKMHDNRFNRVDVQQQQSQADVVPLVADETLSTNPIDVNQVMQGSGQIRQAPPISTESMSGIIVSL